MTRPETLEKKYLGKCSKRSMQFLKASPCPACLVSRVQAVLLMAPPARISSSAALMHAYFEGLAEKDPDPRMAELREAAAKASSEVCCRTHCGLTDWAADHPPLSAGPAWTDTPEQVSRATQPTG